MVALAAALAAVIFVVVRRRRRVRDWQERATTIARSAHWLNDTYLPGLLALGPSQQLQQSWQEGAARFGVIDAELATLRADAQDLEQGVAVEAVRTTLAGLRQSTAHLVDLAAMGAPAAVQLQAATVVQTARSAVTGALSGLPQLPEVV